MENINNPLIEIIEDLEKIIQLTISNDGYNSDIEISRDLGDLCKSTFKKILETNFSLYDESDSFIFEKNIKDLKNQIEENTELFVTSFLVSVTHRSLAIRQIKKSFSVDIEVDSNNQGLLSLMMINMATNACILISSIINDTLIFGHICKQTETINKVTDLVNKYNNTGKEMADIFSKFGLDYKF